ncbi:hypothetical protein P3T76_003943 [Phytophthora citrophthora]|uniref:Transmembrane protein n=1 Tax=Phytophthora citrophthora TaxID=4793 RepID=A0AAD9LPU8_9STRA|nr:hypothetical protein P3T76_003943 [Phytophthora citrophthora]
MREIRRIWRRLYRFFVSFQVELRGHYSASRMESLNVYSNSTSALWGLLICTLSPLPCLLIVTLIEIAPMAPPEAGSSANTLFWGRDYLAIALMTRAIVEQFRIIVPGLEITFIQAIAMPVIASGGATAFMIFMAQFVGFPLPFALVIGIPVWLFVLVVSFAVFFGQNLRQNAVLRSELLNYIIVLVCQVLLTFVYPAYLYGFVHVGTLGQNFYLGLLTVIKLIAKNWMSYFLGTKYDLTPQIMIFNVDVFNALYVSSSMQNSKSINTTLLMVALDAFLAWVSMTDIQDLMRDIILLRRKIPTDHLLKAASFVEVALQIMKEDQQTGIHLARRQYDFGIRTLKNSNSSSYSENSKGPGTDTVPTRVLPVITLPSQPSIAAVEVFQLSNQRNTCNEKILDNIFSDKERQRFVQKAAQVLFTTEFVILVEYTEVIVPFIYSMYMTATYYLPNRMYYPQLKTLDDVTFRSNIGSVALFGVAELLSLLVIGYVIKRKIGVSMLHMLSFVLDRGWRIVQSNLFLWIFYTVQNSLEHNGKKKDTMLSSYCRATIALLVSRYCLVTVSASGGMASLFGESDFRHELTLDKPVLTTFSLEHGESFEFDFNIHFSLRTLENFNDRVMLYLLACDQKATETFLNLPSHSDIPHETMYCAMPNRTLDYYCQSFPLENLSPDQSVYQVTEKIVGSVDNITQTNFAMLTGTNSNNFTFFLDACEMLGGSDTILRSCLEYPPVVDTDSTCFFCPTQSSSRNYPGLSKETRDLWADNCEISPAARQVVLGTVTVNLCLANGKCMWESNRYLLGFYGASTVLWGLAWFVWMVHLHFAPEGSIVALHYKLLSVSVMQVIYSGLSFATKFTSDLFESSQFNGLALVTLAAQVVALAWSVETALYIAAGWNITQIKLERIDVFRIAQLRRLSVEWALAFVLLKQLEVENIGIAVIWGVSWFSIMFLIHYYVAVNLKMLRLRFRLGEQLSVDTSLVMWKGTLFLHYRRLQKGFLFIATVAALTGSDNHWHIWTWISVQGHEMLTFFLYAILSYICRCQQFRFSELMNLQIDVGQENAENVSSEPVSSAELYLPMSTISL